MIVARRRGNIGNIIITAACCTFCVPVTCRPTLTEAALTDNFRVIRVHLGFILSDFMPSSFGQFVFFCCFCGACSVAVVVNSVLRCRYQYLRELLRSELTYLLTYK